MSKTIKRKLLKSSGVRKTEKAVCPIEKSDRLLFYPEQVKQSVFIKQSQLVFISFCLAEILEEC